MATDQVTIANIALSHVGVAATITALDETTAEGRAILTHYNSTLDEVLREIAWPFATVTATLGLVATSDGTQSWSQRWTYAYQYPSDAERALEIDVGVPNNPTPPPFEIVNDATGKLLLTNASGAALRYVLRSTSIPPSEYDADFAAAVAYKIAEKIALPLAMRLDLQSTNAQRYLDAIAKAKLGALNERGQYPQAEAETVRAGLGLGLPAQGAQRWSASPSGFEVL
jgi:hypothetical protein